MTKEINKEILADFRENLNHDVSNNVLKNSVAQVGIYNASENPEAKTVLNPSFNVTVDTGKVSDQKHSGRCWLFSALNTLRTEFAVKNNIKDFELSENYLSFWDRLEKSNYFYKNILDTANLPIEDRKVNNIFAYPNGDGGLWQFAANLITKYGVVPNYVMPETTVSNNTTEFDAILGKMLRKNGIELRKMVADKATAEEIDQRISEMLTEVYKLCVYSFGVPPTDFELSLQTDNDKLIEESKITPKDFLKRYFSMDFDNYADLLNAPQANKEYHKTYEIDTSENMVGGKNQRFLNLPMDRLKELAIEQLKSNTPIWFGNDVLEDSDRKNGYLMDDIYQYDKLFGIDSKMAKGERLDYKQAEISHAMTITGVNIVNGEPNRWKVENSWGESVGEKGYFVMDEKWFENYVYDIVIDKKFLTKEELAEYDQAPEVLPAWDSIA